MHPRLYQPHHYMLYELIPNYVGKDGVLRHNSLGFRGKEINSEKPDSTFRIVCMGESTTYCANLREEETYPVRLEARLRKIYGDENIEVINAGVPGYTSAEGVMNFIFKVQPIKPDLIVYYYTSNDVRPRRRQKMSRDYSGYTKIWGQRLNTKSIRTRMDSFLLSRHSISYLVRRHLEEEYSDEHMERNSSYAFKDNIKTIAMLAKAWGIRILLVNPKYGNIGEPGIDGSALTGNLKAVWEHRLAVEDVAREVGVPILDLVGHMPKAPMFKLGSKESNEFYCDAVHFNAPGADLMAKAVASFIAEHGLYEAPHKDSSVE